MCIQRIRNVLVVEFRGSFRNHKTQYFSQSHAKYFVEVVQNPVLRNSSDDIDGLFHGEKIYYTNLMRIWTTCCSYVSPMTYTLCSAERIILPWMEDIKTTLSREREIRNKSFIKIKMESEIYQFFYRWRQKWLYPFFSGCSFLFYVRQAHLVDRSNP